MKNEIGKYAKAANNVFNLAKALEDRGITLDGEKLRNAADTVKAKTEKNTQAKVVKMVASKSAVKAA